MHVTSAPMNRLLSCILSGCRLPTGQKKRDNNHSEDGLKASKKCIAPSSTASEIICPVASPPDRGNPTIHKKTKYEKVEQSQSMFLSRLPFDVRTMIYEEVLCRPVGVIHITTRKDRTLVYFRCKAEDGRCRGLECFHDPDEDLYSTWRTRDKDLFSTWSPSNTPNMADGGLVALPQTCQQMSVPFDTCSII